MSELGPNGELIPHHHKPDPLLTRPTFDNSIFHELIVWAYGPYLGTTRPLFPLGWVPVGSQDSVRDSGVLDLGMDLSSDPQAGNQDPVGD